MLAAVLREAASQHPDTHYTLLSKGYAEQMLPDLPNLHFLKYGSKIDWSAYDRVIDAHSVWRSWGTDIRALLHFKPIRRICKGRLRKWLLTRGCKTPLPTMLDRYRRLLDTKAGVRSASELPRRDIGIAPFAAHKGKIYPLDKMEEVVRQLSEFLTPRGENIYLFGAGDYEKGILETWEKSYSNVVSLVGKQKMSREIEIMSGLKLMLTMDSGNMHLASLAETRVLSIWGATHPKAGFLGWGQATEDCIQRELPCRPCSVYGKKPCRFGDYRCMDIAPEDITQRVTQAICGNNNRQQ